MTRANIELLKALKSKLENKYMSNLLERSEDQFMTNKEALKLLEQTHFFTPAQENSFEAGVLHGIALSILKLEK